MPVYLPRNLAGMVALASRSQGRYLTGSIRVRDPGNGLYRAEATDGRILAIVQGPIPEADYPALQGGGEGTAEMLVPRDAWVQAFKLGDKRRPVGISADADHITLAVGDQSVQVPSPEEGRFPDVDGVIPQHGPLVAVRVKPELLIELLKLAGAISPEQGVSLLYFGKGKPLGLSTGNDQGQTFDALLMPLT